MRNIALKRALPTPLRGNSTGRMGSQSTSVSALGVELAEHAHDAEKRTTLESTERDDSKAWDTFGDPVRIYLRQIGQTPLLNRQSEFELCRDIEEAQAESKRLMSCQDYLLACERLQQCAAKVQQAKAQMIEANLRLVVSIARRFTGRGLSFLDLIQEGNVGLIHAVDKFEYRRGYRFSTYAVWRIRHAIVRALADQVRTIRIPTNQLENITGLFRAQHRLRQELRREPTNDEVAEEMRLPVDRVQFLFRIAQQPLSLQALVGDHDGTTLEDRIEDQTAEQPSERFNLSLLREKLAQAMATLPERQQRILGLRFGLSDGCVHTLEEIGTQYCLSRERIRQLETKGMRRLRHPTWVRQLQGFLPTNCRDEPSSSPLSDE